MKNITAVVCVWNSIQSIEKCLKSLVENDINIIVVDANSQDGSKEIANRYADQVLTDPGKGLALARNIGIDLVKTEYILNWGVDNILPKGQLKIMLECIEQNNFGGVSAQTLCSSKSVNYFSKSLTLYKKVRYYPGKRSVIGTPTLFRTSLLKRYKFDNNMSHSDDADLCTRLTKENYEFAISNAFVYEFGTDNLSKIIERWKSYGKSDSEIFSKYSKEWNLRRKIQSIAYPAYNELIKPLHSLNFFNKIKMLPFLILITSVRYFFWIKFILSKK